MRKIKVNAIKGRNLTTGEEIDIGLLGQKLPITYTFPVVNGNVSNQWGSLYYWANEWSIPSDVLEKSVGVQVTFNADGNSSAWCGLEYVNKQTNKIKVMFIRPNSATINGTLNITFFFE